MEPGIKTTEFWLSAVASLAAVVFPLLIAYGLLNSEEAQLWQNLILALAAVVVPIVVASVAKKYTEVRGEVKMTAMLNQE